MTEDELGATSIGTDASPKLTLKAVGDSAIYEFEMTVEVAAGLHRQLGSVLSEVHRNSQLTEEASIGNVVDMEGTASLRNSAKG